MSLAKRLLNGEGLQALCVPDEVKEVQAVGKLPVRLQYLRGSAKMGLRLWNVMAPQLAGYPKSGGDNGYPTFSIQGLKERGLI